MEQPIKADDFLSDAPPERIIGSECEYTIQSKSSEFDIDKKRYISQAAIRRAGLNAAGQYLSNGARLYIDVGHLEYATAECLGPEQAAAADLAGALILSDIVEKSDQPHKGVYRTAGTFVNQTGVAKRGHTDQHLLGTTSGYHQNFLYPTAIMHTKLFHAVTTAHLASRIWAMNGVLKPTGYGLSQKSYDLGGSPLNRSQGRRTLEQQKPMYMQHRNDADIFLDSQWSRVEVRYADPAQSPLALYLGFASTSLALRVAEQYHLFTPNDTNQLRISKPTNAARRFADDITFRATAVNAHGKHVTALNLSEMILEKVRVVNDNVQLPEDERLAIDIWQDVLDRMYRADYDSGEYAGLDRMLDSAARHKLLLHQNPKSNTWGNSAESMRTAAAYDLISPKSPAANYWNKIDRPVVNETTIEEFKKSPPPTRAARRAWVVRNRRNRVKYMSWNSIYYKSSSPEALRNPYIAKAQ